ncbi:hypothetical protein GCM10027591_03650 [Zhihengliuella somnathii]
MPPQSAGHWTVPELIGGNVKSRRETLGMTAKELGQHMGSIFGKEGKAWPPQTVYMLEAGERSLIAAEVTALSKILDMPIAELFSPTAEVETISVGSISIPADDLIAPPSGGSDLDALAQDIRALDKVRGKMNSLVQAQYLLISNAKASIRGEERIQVPDDDSTTSALARLAINDAERFYEDDQVELRDLREGLGSGDDGE